MLSLEVLEREYVEAAAEMAVAYTAIAAFERSARELIRKILLEKHGENWWEEGVAEQIRRRAEARRDEDLAAKWHGQRGDDPINYTELGDLAKTMQNNWDVFEPHVRSVEWVKAVFEAIERSRNVIMHSGTLGREDIERVGMNIRDWIRQVGA